VAVPLLVLLTECPRDDLHSDFAAAASIDPGLPTEVLLRCALLYYTAVLNVQCCAVL
jgi:hypothetical protein